MLGVTVLTLLLIFSTGINSAFVDDVASIEPYIFEDLINQTIEALRPDIPDPLQIDSLELDLPTDGDAVVKGNASISNFNLAGLQGFQLTALNFEIIGMQVNFTLNLPLIDFFTDYTADLIIADSLSLFGHGNLSVHLENLEIEASAQANLTGGIQVENLHLQIQIGNATFDFHGLMDDEDLSSLISSILNDLFVKLVDDNQVLISEILSPIVEGVINAILNAILQPTTTAAPTTAAPEEIFQQWFKKQ